MKNLLSDSWLERYFVIQRLKTDNQFWSALRINRNQSDFKNKTGWQNFTLSKSKKRPGQVDLSESNFIRYN